MIRPSLAQAGRRLLREKFARADMGISGAKFAVAKTGTIVLVVQRGQRSPDDDVPAPSTSPSWAWRKVLPRFPRSAGVFETARTGSDGTNAVGVHLAHHRPAPARRDGWTGRVSLVLLGNGRSRVLATPFRESCSASAAARV